MPPDRVFHLCFGSVPLCREDSDSVGVPGIEPFKRLVQRIQERLEGLANVTVLSAPQSKTDFSIRLPRTWVPTTWEDKLEPGPWVFAEFDVPFVFKLHLPLKMQQQIFSFGDRSAKVEDFTVAYDGMIFVCGIEGSGADDIGLAPTVRKYLQGTIFDSIDEFKSAVIPPSPLHLDLDLLLQGQLTSRGPKQDVKYEQASRLITVKLPDDATWVEQKAVEDFYYWLRGSLRRFYHLMVDKSVADELYTEIQDDSRMTHEKYEELLGLPQWKVLSKLKLNREISGQIGGIHQAICEHSLAVITVEEGRRALMKDVIAHPIIGKAAEYFKDQTAPEEIDYSVFQNLLDHMRSHLFVLAQNRYLVYAALLGAVITLVGTVVGYTLHR